MRLIQMGGIKLAIPPDIKLERELITPRWELTDSGLVQVEKQDSIRSRLGRSQMPLTL